MILKDKLVMGTCYYPEHWPEVEWVNDLQRMKAVGITVIRIGEFAWNKIEPKEDEFTYDFFNSFLDLCDQNNMDVIFCTPTATPPAWLTKKYPEVLNVDINGVQFAHGARRHYNYNSRVYNELAIRIVEKIVRNYGKRKCIIGWQIDNEVNCEKDVFYSKSDTIAFREFVKNKYDTLSNLNNAWGTTFWNQTYTSWNEIDVPKPTYGNSTNPHRVLDRKSVV